MAKKNVFILVISAIVIIGIVGGWYYYHYYIDTVTDYFLIKFTPPQPRESMFGGREYSEPKFEFLPLENYANDDVAVESETNKSKDSYTWFLNEYEKELAKPKDDNPIMQAARMNAITSKLGEERILIRTTHIRKFSPEEALQMIQEHWADKSLEDYAKDNKIEVAVYSLSKI